MKTPVVIYLERQPDRDKCLEALLAVGLVKFRDFRLPTFPDIVDQEITELMPQLLITGEMHGAKPPADLFVSEIKKVSPRLKAVWFSTHGYAHKPYDMFIQRGQEDKPFLNLVSQVEWFLRRRRTPF